MLKVEKLDSTWSPSTLPAIYPTATNLQAILWLPEISWWCEHAHVHVCTQRPEADIRCLSQSLFIVTGPPVEPRAHLSASQLTVCSEASHFPPSAGVTSSRLAH